MANVSATYVTSVNGLTGEDFYELLRVDQDPETGEYKPVFVPAGSRNKHVVLDADDIHITGSTGDTVKEGMLEMAGNVQPLIMEALENRGDYRMKIADGIELDFISD